MESNFGAGFLFGNVDKEGRLESDVFDDDEKKHLNGLSSMGVTGLIEEYNEESKTLIEDDDYDAVPPSPWAVDYSKIELEDEENELPSSESDQNVGDIILPSCAPSSGSSDIILPSISNNTPVEKKASHEITSDVKKAKDKKKRHKEYSEQDRMFKQLQKMIKRKTNAADLQELFPAYEPEKPLRFLKLFEHTQNNVFPNPYRWLSNKKKSNKYGPFVEKPEVDEKHKLKPLREAKEEEIAIDEAKTSLAEMSWCVEAEIAEEELKEETPKKIPNWRNGPAKLWYDILSVPEDGAGFHYGFKLRPDIQKEFDEMDEVEREKRVEQDNEDKFNYNIWEHLNDEMPLYCQVQWEDDIIWKPEDVSRNNRKPSTGARVDKEKLAGWVPNGIRRDDRSALSIEEGNNQSIFPLDNYELIYGDWERKIIWDSQNMDYLPKPRDFKVNPNDEKLILYIPDDPEPRVELKAKETKNKRQIFKMSKEVLRNVGIGQKNDDVDDEIVPNLRPEKDIWNLSNDEFYDSKAKTEKTRGSLHSLLQHSTPAIELQHPFFPTHLEQSKLRKFHRPPFNISEIPTGMTIKVLSCVRASTQMEKSREQERQATGGGDVFFMRKKDDLSSKDAEVVLVEYCEEYPPLFNQIGMASIIKIWRRRTCRDKPMDRKYDYGEPAYYTQSPFLGHVNGETSQAAFENQMFRSPLYFHKAPETDFLLIRDGNQWHIRKIPNVFLLGQQCPLIDVPGPNSKKHTNFLKDFLMVYLYRLFLQSEENPKKIRMEEVRKAFPTQSEGSIRKRLKSCAEFKRTGIDSNWWVLSPEFRLPTEEETRSLVKPEEACAFYSMLAAQQNLKDAGYREKSLLLDDKDEDEDPSKVEVEIQCAPWHTTRAFLAAMKNKCLLDITGAADPTGPSREGFSYIKIPNKPSNDDNKAPQPRKLVTGTDADLRRLNLKQAKEMLKKWGFNDANIDKLSRWEVIDVVRSMSTQQARAGDGSFGKFARGNRFSAAEHHERYKEECQQQFDLQNKQLASDRVLTTDDSSSEEDDDYIDKMEKNLDALFSNQKTSRQLQEEREERERLELIKELKGHKDKTLLDKGDKDKPEKDVSQMDLDGKLLTIKRRYVDTDGIEKEKVETIKKTEVIEAYLKIKYSKTDSEALRRYLAENSDEEKERLENMRRERRRLQETVRRINKNKQKLFAKEKKLNESLKNQTPIEESDTDDDTEETIITNHDGLVKVEDTKLILNKKLLTENKKRRRQISSDQDAGSVISLGIEVQRKKKKEIFSSDEKRPRGRPRKKRQPSEADYLLHRPMQKRERLRADPMVSISSIFEKILTDMRTEIMSSMEPFIKLVDKKMVPDYYDVVTNAISIQCVREKLREHKYATRDVFLEDIELIYTNSRDYNGAQNPISLKALELVEFVKEKLCEEQDKLVKLERKINPLLDDNYQNKLSYILNNIISNSLWNIEGCAYFQAPVDRKRYKDYASIIENPMDLKTIKKNISRHYYQNRTQFKNDIQLIYNNSVKYNGTGHECTVAAKTLVEKTDECLALENEELCVMEEGIIQSQTQSQNEFLGDLELSDDELEDGQDGPDPMDATLESSIDVPLDGQMDVNMEDDDTNDGLNTDTSHFVGGSALDGLDLSESEDEAPPETDLKSAFEGPTDLFGVISDLSDDD